MSSSVGVPRIEKIWYIWSFFENGNPFPTPFESELYIGKLHQSVHKYAPRRLRNIDGFDNIEIHVDNNEAPTVIIEPIIDEATNDIIITYNAQDQENDEINVYVDAISGQVVGFN